MENITLKEILYLIGAIGIILGVFIKLHNMIKSQDDKHTSLDNRISTLEAKSKQNEQENRLMLKGLLACLKGLKEQGCNGPVTQSIEEIDDYLIKK